MKSKVVTGIMLTLLVISMLTFAFNIQLVKAEGGTIYIRADGSVDPPTAPIERVGEVYTFTDNIYDSIIVQRDNIVVDGASYKVKGTGAYGSKGINLYQRSNVTIKNMEIETFDIGIYLDYSSNCNILGNNITSNDWYGIDIWYSSYNTLSGNNIVGNGVVGISLIMSANNLLRVNSMVDNLYNFAVYGDELADFVNDVDNSNMVNGKPIYYWVNKQNAEVPSGAGYVALVNCTQITVRNQNLTNNGPGLLVAFTGNSLITQNNITNNIDGVELCSSSNNIIINNTIIANGHEGIYLNGSSNIIRNNIVADHLSVGIVVYGSNNTLISNTVTNTLEIGISISSSFSKIYHNNFIDNAVQAGGYGTGNVWDDGYPSGGNFWSNYTGVDEFSGPNQDVPGSDDIGDTPYVIDADNQDRYPLMKPWTSGLPVENTPPIANAGQDMSVFSGDLVLFNGSKSYDTDGTIVNYQWDFGDDTTAEGKIISHRFRGAQNEPKTYAVTLTVEDDDGATDTGAVYVTVAPLEKTIEVSHQPTVPIPGQPVFGKMTVTYNWINDDNYVVSKIHYESGGFLGFGDISIWDMHSHVVPTPVWATAIPSFWNEKTYYPTLERVEYGGDTFKGISVEAFDAMNIYIIGWAGMSISTDPYSLPFKTFFFKTASACFEPSSTGVPDVPIEAPNLYLAYLGSPGELRVYDSQAQVTGLVNGAVKEQIPNSACSNNTVMILSPSSSYRYEVAGTEDGSYGLIVASIIQGENNTFTALDIPISANAIHQYTIDWAALSQGEEGVTVQIDSDEDGTFEETFTSDSQLTRDEFMLQVPSAEAFPWWILGAVAAVMLGVGATLVVWKRRKPES